MFFEKHSTFKNLYFNATYYVTELYIIFPLLNRKIQFSFNLNFFEYQYGLEIQYKKSIDAGHEKCFFKYIKYSL